MEEDEGVCWATQAFPPSPPALPDPHNPIPAIAEEKERNLEINWTQHGESSSSSSQWAELDVLLDSFTPQPASGTAAPTTTTTPSRGSSVDYSHLHAGLNAEQREAAEAPVERPLLICAGPGTGKTLTLCHRIVDLVARQNVRPEAILAITFSRKAADEMRHRLDSLCPLTRPVTVSNFHRFCWRLLRLSRDAGGSVGRDLEVIEKRRQAELIEECLELWSQEEEEKGNAEANDEEDSVDVEEEDDDGDEEEPGQRRAKRRRLEAPSKESSERQARLTMNYFLQFIGRAKANLPLSQEYDEKWDAKHRFVYTKYQERLEEEGLVDFHDMIRKSVQLLTTDPALLARYQQMFQVVLVDEFQDTSRLQWELVRLLAQPHKAVTVIGDPHQTIYSFRGTNFDNWKEFHRSFGEGALYLSLQQNYRSSKTILQAAQSVISNNPSLSTSAVELGFALPYTRLHTTNAQGNLVGLTVCEDWETEMRRVIATIKEKSRRKEYRYRDMCVLFRNFKSRGFSLAAFEEALAQRNVPYVVSGADRDAAESSGWQPSTVASGGESEVIVDCLSLIVDTNDTDECFIRVLHATSAGTLMDGLRARARVEGTSLFRAAKLYIATATEGEKDDGHRVEVLRRIVKMVERTRAELLLDSWVEDESEERDDSASPARASKGPARAPRKSLADVIEAVAKWLERVDDTDGDGEGDHQEQDQDSERDFLLTDSAAEQRCQSTAEFVNRLKKEAIRYETTRRLDDEGSTFSVSLQELLADFVQQRASGSASKHEGGGKQNAITLSTIHRAKGLEWPVVFLVQMNETVMPSWQALKSLLSPEGATEDEQRDQHTRALEEERRLCYVAMTRARERLFISFVNNSRGDAKVSRFVLEIPEALVVATRVAEEERSDREESENDDVRGGGGGGGSDISEGDEENEDDDGEEDNGGVGGRLVRLFRPLKKRGLVPVKTADPVAQPSKRAKRRVIFVRSRRRSTTAEPLHAVPHGPASPPPALAPQPAPPPPLSSSLPAVADETTASLLAMMMTTTTTSETSEAATFPPARRFLRSSRTKRPPLVRPSAKDEQRTDDRDEKEENASDDDDDDDDDDESDEDDEADNDDEGEEEESDTPKKKGRHPHLPPARRYVSPNSKQNMKSRSRESVHGGPAPPLVFL